MEKRKTQWHPAFYSAIQLELKENRDDLVYDKEHVLNTKPVQIDLLVIRRTSNKPIQNEIGKLFKGHNMFEYKSPGDDLNIDVFYKGISYASAYKAQSKTVDGIKADDITITYVRNEKPVKLMKMLKKYDFLCEQDSNGIYVYKNICAFDVQIIVVDELKETEHIWLKALNKRIKKSVAKELVKEYDKQSTKLDRELSESVLQVAVKENNKIFETIKEELTVCEALIELMQPEIEEKVNEKVSQKMEEITQEVTQQVTEQVTQQVTEEDIPKTIAVALKFNPDEAQVIQIVAEQYGVELSYVETIWEDFQNSHKLK